MARKKTTASIDAEIKKIQTEMSKLQDRYDRLADQLKELQEKKRELTAYELLEAFEKSGKSYQETMTFFKP